MLTLRDLLRDLDVRVLTGEGGLDLPVRWVHISELLDPTPWLSGGELLLSTGMQLDDAAKQREFVARIAEHQLVGLGVGTGFKHNEVPQALLEEAAERDFPVFEVPYELPFIALTEAAFTQLVNEQYAVLRRALTAHERLERIVLSERGLDALVATLCNLIGGSVLVFDGRGELLAQRAFRTQLEPEALAALQAAVQERSHRRDGRAFVPEPDAQSSRGLALPVAADEGPRPGSDEQDKAPEAWLVALKDAGGLSDFDRLTLHQAVTIVALELLRHRVADDTERRLAGDVLAGVVSGELVGPELVRRLEPFGLADRVAAIVVQHSGDGRRAAEAVEAALSTALREESTPGLVASTASLTCAFVLGLPEAELFPVAERVGARIAAGLGSGVRVGTGRAVAGADARRSFHEARCALEAVALAPAGGRGNGNGGQASGGGATSATANVATYKDLGSFQLLLSLQDDEALRLFCDSILAPIETGEGHYGGELMRSLEAFIEENGQWERAARRLYCHRHTLRYRIRRIEELTGRDLQNARDRIEFWLALRGRELVS
jgi:PucR family transcriptional regulator, purine catabolism regulatory protein